MAIVLSALASSVLNMLAQMTKEEVTMLFGVSSEMDKMGIKLRDLKNYLADADRRNITEQRVQEWVRELKGAMYDATNILDLCQLKAMERGKRIDAGCFNPLLFCMRNPLFAHDIGSRMKKLSKRLDDIKERSAAFNFIPLYLSSEDDRSRNSTSSRSSSRETSGELNESTLVGEKIKEDTRSLVEMLTKEEQTTGAHEKIMVFAIVGVGGIGKTTLAQKILNDDTIQHEFTKKVWLSVNQDFNATELLRKAITEAGGDYEASRNTKGALERTLKEALMGHKTLLVMDDVWDQKAWVDVLETPLADELAAGSRVLVTTRHDMVARGMRAVEPYHRIDKLKDEDAWSFLKKQVIRDRNDEARVDALKDIGMGIVKKCDGLPLAVKVMGGLLRQKRIRRTDWENVLKDFTCGKIFDDDEIFGMWIGKGLVHGNLDDDLEKIGREYYDELILRNLIEPNNEFVDQIVCSMHDVVRSFAHYVARDEALVLAGHNSSIIGKLNSQNFIRLSIENEGSESDQLEWMSLKEQRSLRTLISIGNIKIKPGDSLIAFPCLRNLHVHNADFDKLSESLVQLKHLRYLSVEETNTSVLPENIRKMKFLQYINLSGCQSLVKLPDSIGKLPDLRFLSLEGTSINNVPRGFGGLTNLRTLYGFPSNMDGDWCSLEELGPLSKLTRLSIYSLENVSSASIATKAKLDGKVCLRFLNLACSGSEGDNGQLLKEEDNIFSEGQKKIEDVFDELCPPPSLENLIIVRYSARQLPRWMTSTAVHVSLGSLRILTLKDLPYCTDLPDGLYQLPYLEFLQILHAPAIKRVGPVCLQQHHHEHLSAPGSLGCGLTLEVTKCSGLERIGNMPKLHELTIISCPKLKALEGVPALQRLVLEDYDMQMLPGYLRDVNPRHLLEIICDVSLLTSIAAGKSGHEWDKFKHIKLVKAYGHDGDIERKWYVLYTREDPFSFKTNISLSAINKAKKERARLAYWRACPVEDERPEGRRAYTDKRQPLCQRFRCNAYRHLVLWLREACLHCSEAGRIADASDPWTEEAVYRACTRIRLTAQ